MNSNDRNSVNISYGVYDVINTQIVTSDGFMGAKLDIIGEF